MVENQSAEAFRAAIMRFGSLHKGQRSSILITVATSWELSANLLNVAFFVLSVAAFMFKLDRFLTILGWKIKEHSTEWPISFNQFDFNLSVNDLENMFMRI